MAMMLIVSCVVILRQSLRTRLPKKGVFAVSQIAAISVLAEGLSFSSLPKRLLPTATEPMVGPTYSWCSTASINPESGSISVQQIAGSEHEASSMKVVGDRCFDLTVNSDWFLYIENTEDRADVEGGAGAYDVMRCDLEYRPSHDKHPMEPSWLVWGEDFHLSRLRNSFGSLLAQMAGAAASSEEIEGALTKSRSIIRTLLMEAHQSKIMQSLAPPEESEVSDVIIQLVKLSILWTPSANDKNDPVGNQDVIVRGHACSSCKPTRIHKRPVPIVAAIALPLNKSTEGKEPKLPSRFLSPQIKVASWCRLRSPLEDPETYKPPGVGEVLMVGTCASGQEGRMEILEGLTSNFFAIYKDGTIRTAEKGVLEGYVRHLVLDCAERAGLRRDYSPVLIDDASKGLLESTFITSSSRLICPISQILIPEVSDDDESDSQRRGVVFRELWSDLDLMDGKTNQTSVTPRWLNLLNEVLKEGGYDTMTAS